MMNTYIFPLTSLILTLTSLVDSQKYNEITISDIHREVEKENILNYLSKTCGKEKFDSFMDDKLYPGFKAFYEESMASTYNAYGGQEQSKLGINNFGLCLLIAWTNELLKPRTF